jgi:hypothetical protein
MAVRISPARTDHRHAWLHRFYERIRGSRAAPMVRDLQHIQLIALTRDPGGQQLGIDPFLDVAGEDHPACAELNVQNDRHVIDRRSRIGRS